MEVFNGMTVDQSDAFTRLHLHDEGKLAYHSESEKLLLRIDHDNRAIDGTQAEYWELQPESLWERWDQVSGSKC